MKPTVAQRKVLEYMRDVRHGNWFGWWPTWVSNVTRHRVETNGWVERRLPPTGNGLIEYRLTTAGRAVLQEERES